MLGKELQHLPKKKHGDAALELELSVWSENIKS